MPRESREYIIDEDATIVRILLRRGVHPAVPRVPVQRNTRKENEAIKQGKPLDMNICPEAYQKRFVEEYVAAHPDTFDTICLVDLRGGFNLC